MSIQERITQAEQRFDELTTQKQDIDTELARLQGEWRVLQDLLKDDQAKVSKPNKKATVIEAVAEETK